MVKRLRFISLFFVLFVIVGCGTDIDEEPPEPPVLDYTTITKRHLSHHKPARITSHNREGNFVEYYAFKRYNTSTGYATTRYTVLYELVNNKWQYITTIAENWE